MKTEVEIMLHAHIRTPALSAWSLPVVIATEKDEKARLCANYWVLNQKLKPDMFPVSKVQNIFNELADGAVFTTLDLFSGYLPILLSENCKEENSFVFRLNTF